MQPPWPPPASPSSTAMSSPRCPGATAPSTRPTCGPCPDGGLACCGPAGIHRLDDDARLRHLPGYQRTACDWKFNLRAFEVRYLDPLGAGAPLSGIWILPEATMPSIDLPIGPVDYRVCGPTAPDTPVAVFVHGFLVNATLWDPVATLLAADGVRCILPDRPLGAHRRPVNPDADLSPIGVADAITGLLDALDLHDVVLVGSKTGGGLCQLALRGDTHRIRGLVLTNCDAFEQFPPRFFVPLFLLARSRPAVWTLAQQTRLRAVRHSPLGFGPLLNRLRPATLTRGWIQPLLDSAAIRH